MTGIFGLELAVGSKFGGIPLKGLKHNAQKKPLPKREERGPLYACLLASRWALVYPIPLHVCATIYWDCDSPKLSHNCKMEISLLTELNRLILKYLILPV